jgi:hypothetical protein
MRTCRKCGGEDFYARGGLLCRVCLLKYQNEYYHKKVYQEALKNPKHCRTCGMELLPFWDGEKTVIPKTFCDADCKKMMKLYPKVWVSRLSTP